MVLLLFGRARARPQTSCLWSRGGRARATKFQQTIKLILAGPVDGNHVSDFGLDHGTEGSYYKYIGEFVWFVGVIFKS